MIRNAVQPRDGGHRILLTNVSLCLTDRFHPSGALFFAGTKTEAVLFHPRVGDGFAGEVIGSEELLAAMQVTIESTCYSREKS